MSYFKSIKEFIFVTTIFVSIILTTSFHYVTSPPNVTFEPGAFHVNTSTDGGGDPLIGKYFKDFGLIYEKFFDKEKGKWTNNFHPRIMTGWNDMWKNTGMATDSAYYIMYAGKFAGLINEITYDQENANLGMRVHRYRVFLPFVVGNIIKLSKLNDKKNYEWNEKYISRIVYVYLGLNFFFIYLTSIIFLFFLKNVFNFNKYYCVLGSLLFITLPIVTRSSGFPQAEPISLLISLLLFYFTFERKVFLFLITAFIAVMTRDLFIYASVLWFVTYNYIKKGRIFLSFFDILISIIPIIFFIILRFYFSDSFQLETRGSYDLLKGELPPFPLLDSLMTISGLFDFLIKYFFVFTFLWLGIFKLNKNELLMRSSLVIVFLTLISMYIARGSGIERHVGLMYPIIIPAFLYFIHFKSNKIF